MDKDRRDKINEIKRLLRGEGSQCYVKRAKDGNYYHPRDIITVTYEITFPSLLQLKEWQAEHGLEMTAYCGNTVTLRTEYEPVEGARPRRGKPSIADRFENINVREDYRKREETRERLCDEYIKRPPKGFTVTRRPYSKMIF